VTSFFKIFWPKIFMCFFSPVPAICSTDFIHLQLIILITFGKEYKSCSSPLCSFLLTSLPCINLNCKMQQYYKCAKIQMYSTLWILVLKILLGKAGGKGLFWIPRFLKQGDWMACGIGQVAGCCEHS
jgi:hypothetical protein